MFVVTSTLWVEVKTMFGIIRFLFKGSADRVLSIVGFSSGATTGMVHYHCGIKCYAFY
jgi:hypothetical protein